MTQVWESAVARSRLHVLIFWEIMFRPMAPFLKKHGGAITEEWVQHRLEWSSTASDTCQTIGEGHTDEAATATVALTRGSPTDRVVWPCPV
jgi:hypothetical protein